MSEQVTAIDLSQFYCSDNFYRHWLGLVYTDGLKYLAEQAGAYWLIDAIASHQRGVARKARIDARLADFQIWKLKANKRSKGCSLCCYADSGEKPAITQRIEFTDFPFDAVGDFKVYVENGIMMLSTER